MAVLHPGHEQQEAERAQQTPRTYKVAGAGGHERFAGLTLSGYPQRSPGKVKRELTVGVLSSSSYLSVRTLGVSRAAML